MDEIDAARINLAKIGLHAPGSALTPNAVTSIARLLMRALSD
jgi:hypothetical protein